MSSKYVGPGNVIQMLMGTNGTAGDLMYVSTGSALTYKSAADGTANSDYFIGVLEDTTGSNKQAAIRIAGIVQLEKHAAANKIEVGDIIFGTCSSNLVGTVAGGTALGVCVNQSATTDTYVDTLLITRFTMGVGGFHA